MSYEEEFFNPFGQDEGEAEAEDPEEATKEPSGEGAEGEEEIE